MIDISNRPDFQHIVDVVPQKSRVLDLGCGDGSLLAILKKNNIMGLGIEKDESEIYKCIEKGIIVHHGDLDGGLDHHLEIQVM